MKKQAKQPAANLLDLKPCHNVAWEKTNDDRIALVTPRVQNPVLRKLFKPLLKNPDFRIFLDEYGSWIWQHIDGDKTVSQLGELMEQQFGEAIQPVYDRLGLYINQLARHRFILLQDNNPF
ncbi:PqqD family protein [candidate division KSB1 bacterium]|nr:PqqD family protein [candidate division KSB1 bacterium]